MQQNIAQLIISLILTLILLFFYWRLRLKKLVAYQSSLLGKVEIFQKYNGEKVLTINSYPQGVSIEDTSISKSYWFQIAEKVCQFCQNKKDQKILMLGLGANTIPNLIAKKNSSIHQTIIEIDKEIIKACRKYFNLDKLPNYQIIQTDAFHFFSSKPAPSKAEGFDIIIVDIFTGEPPYVSLDSNQPNFITKILPFLKGDGMIIFNRPAHNQEARDGGMRLKKYLDTLFQKTEILNINDPRRFKNHVIIAKKKIS